MRTNPRLSAVLSSPWPIIVTWWLGGLLAIIVPVLRWKDAKEDYYVRYGKYAEYENNQRSYQEAQNNNYNNNNQNNNYNNQNSNYNNNNNNYNQNNDGDRSYNCGWWQYKCRQEEGYYLQARSNNNDGNQMSFYTPGWYSTLGGRYDQEDMNREEMGSSFDNDPGALKFVYAWSLIIFISLLIYGTVVFYKRRSSMGLTMMLAFLTQYSLLVLLLLPQGVIETDNEQLEGSVYGWYGQIAVLMVYSNFAQFLFAPIFIIIVSVKAGVERLLADNSAKADKEEDFDYRPAGRTSSSDDVI
jgi:hypothetical protein